MKTKFTRRQSLQALATMALAAGALAIGARRPAPELHVKPWRQIAMEVLSGPPMARELMLASMASQPSHLPAECASEFQSTPAPRGVSWSDEGCVYERASDLKRVIALIRERVRTDLDAGRVVLAGGWVISRTEASLVAMCVGPAGQLSEGSR